MAGAAAAVDSAEEVPVEAGKKWPHWLHGFITPEDAQRVSEAVERAEALTTGEIVPIIVRRSSTIGHVPWLVTLILLVVILVFEVPQMSVFSEARASWLLLLLSIACLLLSIPLSKSTWMQRLLVPQGDQAFQVEARALLEFYSTGVTATKSRTGVLLFISLMERKAVVLADEGISHKLPRETWAHICEQMVDGIKKGQTAEGLIGAVHKGGELLAQHFPHGPEENINEISNQLILKE